MLRIRPVGESCITSTRSAKLAASSRDLATALLAPAIALASAELLYSTLGLTRLGIFFLAAVTFVASLRGTRAAIAAALISVVCYKLFLDLRAGEQTGAVEDLLAVLIFLVVALVTGTLAGRVHDEAASARHHAASMEMLFNASRALSHDDGKNFWPTLARTISQASGGAALALDAAGDIRARSGVIADESLAVQLGQQLLEGANGAEQPTAKWQARTIPRREPFAGVLLWEAQHGNGPGELPELLTDLASASLARAQIRQEQVRVQASEEAGKLREALLSSISHDFRSPLAAIIGSSTSLLEYGDKFDGAVTRDLLLNIQDEGEKLNRFVANLLDMTRLQSGVVRPASKTCVAAAVAGSAIEQLRRHRGEHMPPITVDADCPVDADPLLLEQALYNILDNAAKYGSTEQGIEVTCERGERHSTIVIADHGPGLPHEDRCGIFTAFHFVRKSGRTKGTGLGLSIARGFVEAMGGTIEARDRRDGQSGLEIAINLPRSSE